MVFLILVLVGLLAFANGSNDNCKGVATLVGFGAARPRQALIWATLTTAIGAAISFWLAAGLIASFSTGLFAQGTPLEGAFFVAVLIGAIGWVLFATFTGLPVSTTHAIMGGLLGSGVVALSTGQIRWEELGSKFAVPLALGPVLSLVVVYLVSWPIRSLVRRYEGRCVCVVQQQPMSGTCAASVVASPALNVVTDTEANCSAASPAVTVSTSAAANAVHWATSGLVGFARGWNDAPKIAALSIGTLSVAGVPNGTAVAFAVVTVAMAVGGFVAGRRVLETMARNLTPLPLAESLTASLTTATLVCTASWVGLPVSTTHVSTGAIIGAGLRNDPGEVRWRKVGEIVLSWVTTLPVAALISAVALYLMR